MIEDIHDKHLVDRYLQGELSGIELDDFNRRLATDEHFKNEVSFREIIYSGINLAKEQQLQSQILSSINYRKPSIPYALKLIIVFLVITASGITLCFYVGNDNKATNGEWQVPKEAWQMARNVFTRHPSPGARHREETTATVTEKISDTLQTAANSESSKPTTLDTKDTTNTALAEDIVVKQDQLLITVAVPIVDKSTEGKPDADHSLTAEAVQKLNPSADLPPDVETKAATYDVEFWVSPINYRGYKMSKNKLLLFGIDEPDAVKLFRFNDTVYMSYFKDLYRLTITLEFMPYQKLKEPEIPLALR